MPTSSTFPPTPRTLDVLLAEPGRAGLFCDFDGTLSAIVDRPEDARPLPGVPDVLRSLSGVLRRVGLVSGRPVSFLEPFFPPPLLLSGLYGLETRRDDTVEDHPQAGAWREVVADVVATAQALGPDGMRVESKGLSITLHYRGHPELAADVEAWGRHQAARSGLQLRPAKMSFELHPPISADKGSAVAALADGLSAVAYLGDDIGDLAAFAALDVLAVAGVATVRVAVAGEEQADALVERADVTVHGPEGALGALRDLAGRAGGAG